MFAQSSVMYYDTNRLLLGDCNPRHRIIDLSCILNRPEMILTILHVRLQQLHYYLPESRKLQPSIHPKE